MEPTNLTIEILKSIRDDVKGVREEVNGVRKEVKGIRDEVKDLRDEIRVTNERLDAVREQQVHTEMRLATELVAGAAEFRGLRDDLRTNGFFRTRLDDHEARIEALEKRSH